MNKPRKFKLIKEYPGSGELGKILTDKCEKIENWPEYWEEIKDEPILITEDGKELFKGDEYYKVNTKNWELTIPSFNLRYNYKKEAHCIYFSTFEKADEWFSENKPKWSDIDMKVFARDWEDYNYDDNYNQLTLGQYFEKWKEDSYEQ